MTTQQENTNANSEESLVTSTKRHSTATLAIVAVAAIALTAGTAAVAGTFRGAETPPAATNPSGNTGTPALTGEAGTLVAGEYRGADSVKQAEVLVSADWLEENLDNPDVVIIEVSEERSTSTLTRYEQGHIPGSVELVWYRDFVEQLTRDIVSQQSFTELAQQAGVNQDSTIVLYGDTNNWFAAYGAWVFKLYGAEDVRLLDGGRNKWEADGRVLDVNVPIPAQGNLEALPQNLDIRALKNEVFAIATGELDSGLIDIRGAAEFRGEIAVAEGFSGEAAAKLGHIPGAINVPWGALVNPDGTYKSADEIRAVYEEAGLDFSKPIVVYCRIGERASHTWYALSQILGLDVKVYDGSWTEWGNSVGLPVTNLTLAGTDDRSGLWGNR